MNETLIQGTHEQEQKRAKIPQELRANKRQKPPTAAATRRIPAVNMPCYSPLQAYQCLDGAIVFAELKRHNTIRTLWLACGQCIGCRLERSRQWAIRCMHESRMHKRNAFITLTYDDANIPPGGTLEYRDFQLFMKRLRERERKKSKSAWQESGIDNRQHEKITTYHIGRYGATPHAPMSFYMCGEYGERTRRPHYHACLFGYDFEDRKHWRTTPAKAKLYTSQLLNELWGKGHTTIGDVTFESAAYVARYIMKKITGPNASASYEKMDPETGEIIKIEPEFTHMSLKNPIGKRWLKKYATDAYPEGRIIIRNQQSRTPRYYDREYKKMDPLGYDDLLYQREQEAKKRPGENMPHRLKARETVAHAKIKLLKRGLE